MKKAGTGGYGGSAHKGNGARVTTNRQTLKSGSTAKMSMCGNDGNTKSTTLPGYGRPANAKGASTKGHMDY